MKNFKKLLLALTLFSTTAFGAGWVQNEDVKSISDLQTSAGSITGNLSSGSACIASPSSIVGLSIGMYAYDASTSANIPSGTTILGFGTSPCTSGQIKLSANAAGTATGDTITFGGTSSQLVNDTKIWLTTTTPPQQLSSAITSGAIGGGGSGASTGANLLSDANGQAYPSGSVWTVTSGTGAADTANYTDGVQSIKVTASSQQSTLSQSVTPSAQLASGNYQASMWVKTSLTNVQVCALAAGTAVNCTPVSSANTWAPYTVTFVGPSSGSVGIQVGMTSSGTGTFNAQLGYVGKALNTAMLSQAQLLGTVTITACGAQWSQSGGSTFADFSAVSGCSYATTGAALAPATNLPAIKFASLAPGEYLLEAEGNSICSSGGSSNYCQFQFWDGTNTAREQTGDYVYGGNATGHGSVVQSIAYTTAQSNVQFSLRNKNNTSGNITYLNGTTALPLVIKVYYFPSQQQAGYRADATPASWSGYQSFSSGWSTSSSVLVAPSAGSGITTTQVASRNISCSSFGTAAGITCTLPRAGNYQVCNTALVGGANGTTVAIEDGSGNPITKGAYWNATSAAGTLSQCGIYNASAAGGNSFQLYLASTSGSGNINTSLGAAAGALQWTVVELDAPMPAPYLVGSVTSNTSGGEHVERASIANNGTTASITSQSGSWISSATRISSGNVTLAIPAGEFSAAPSCSVTRTATGSGTFNALCAINTESSTSLNVQCANVTSSSTSDAAFDIICMGPH